MTFQSLYMLKLSAMLKRKALLLEKEAWGNLAASLAGTRTTGLWDILEDLFAECSESEGEEGPPSKKIHQQENLLPVVSLQNLYPLLLLHLILLSQ